MSVLILGGNRFMGRHLAELLLALGERPVVLNRGSREPMTETEFVPGDRSQRNGLAALHGRTFDAVVDLSAYQSQWVRDAIRTLSERTKHYIFISSGVVYRRAPTMPWSEGDDIAPDPTWGSYAVEKVASEKLLAAAAEQGAFQVTILRPPFVMGAGNYADRESFIFSRLYAARPILLPGGGRAVNQYVSAADVARAIMAVIRQPGSAPVRAFNVGLPCIVSNRGLAELCAEISGRPLDAIAIDADALGVASSVVDLTDIVFPFPDAHSFLDVRAIEEAVGFKAAVSLEVSLAEYHAWWLRQPDRMPREYPRETLALTALRRGS